MSIEKAHVGNHPGKEAEFEQSLCSDLERKIFCPKREWLDSRKGDLFALVDALQSNRNQDTEGQSL